MCVSCGTVLLCDCTRMQTGTENWKSIAATNYEAGRAEGMREAARYMETSIRVHAALHGGSGFAWNISSMLKLVDSVLSASAIGERQ